MGYRTPASVRARLLCIAIALWSLAATGPSPAQESGPWTLTVKGGIPFAIFDKNQPAVFEIKLVGEGLPATGTIRAEVTDYFGDAVGSTTLTVAMDATKWSDSLVLNNLDCGYYEIRTTAVIDSGGDSLVLPEVKSSFGVVEPIARSADDALAQRSRFGLKAWTTGGDPAIGWDLARAYEVCAKLGLQWTRLAAHDKNFLSTADALSRFPINAVLKIEGIGACFDEGRYGPFDAYAAANPQWSKGTMPHRDCFINRVKEVVSALPPQAQFFEVWNEPWQYAVSGDMTAQDFAKLCAWTADAVHQVRPEARVGPNLHGIMQVYDVAFIEAGGLDDSDLITFHPYTSGTPENKNFAAHLTNYRDMVAWKTGRRFDLYSTEYGWSTAPQGERVVDERTQAQYVVRESIMLYALEVKTLIPHIMGGIEADPAEREDYFGFFRRSQEPKPVVLAYANCARLIDGSTFVNELWFGFGIGAMRFAKNGEEILALWTEGEEREISVPCHTHTIKRCDTMGGVSQIVANSQAVATRISGDVIYLIGPSGSFSSLNTLPAPSGLTVNVGSSGNRSAWRPPRVLNSLQEVMQADGRWKTRKRQQDVFRVTEAPTIDGALNDWQSIPAQVLTDPKYPGFQVSLRYAWDPDHLYLAVEVLDNAVLNDNGADRLVWGDALDFRVCAFPERQVEQQNFYDLRFIMAPTSATGVAALAVSDRGLAALLVNPETYGKWKIGIDAKYWRVEAAIPFSALRSPPRDEGQVLAAALVVTDRDTREYNEWTTAHRRIESYSREKPFDEMPYLVLRGPAPSGP